MRRGERGFTMLELLVALGAAGLLMAGIGGAMSAIFRTTSGGTSRVTAVTNVDNALSWVTRDALMAQEISPAPGAGFPLTLDWRRWDGSAHQVTYSLSNGELSRRLVVDGVESSQVVVARGVASASTSSSFAAGVLTLQLAATGGKGGAVQASRTTQILARSGVAQ